MKKLVTIAVFLAACSPAADVTTTSPSTTTPVAPTTTATPVAPTTTTTYPLAEPDVTRLRLAVFDFGEDGWDGPNLLPVSLWRVHQPSGLILPLLAAAPQPQPATLESDGWVIDVPLREGVSWSDGTPVTAIDVAFTASYNDWPAVVEPTSRGVALVFAETPRWAGFMADVGLQALLPAHYWDPLIDQGVEPGTSWEHDLAAPTAAGYRYVEHTQGTVLLDAVPDWWDRGSTYESFTDGVRWINPVLGTDETFGSASSERIAIQENGPHVSEVFYRQTEGVRLVSDVVSNEADMSLSPIAAGFWTGRETDTATPLLNKAPAITVFLFGEAAADPIIRDAVSCMVDVEFLRNNVLQGVARPFDLVGIESESACRGDDESRLSEAVSILAEHGWTWDRIPSNPFPQPYETRPLANDDSGRSLAPSIIRSPGPAVDPLSATAAVWISAWTNGLGIPTTPVSEVGEQLVGQLPPAPDSIEFGAIIQTEHSTFPSLELARTIASADTPWSDLAADHAAQIEGAPDQASYDRAVAEFIEALLAENSIIPLYRPSRQDIYNNWVVLPYTEATDGFGSIEHVLEAIRMER